MMYRPAACSMRRITGHDLHMSNGYTDAVEIQTRPAPARCPFIPADAKIVLGASPRHPRIRSRSCCCLVSSYRVSEWRHPDTHEVHCRLERRRAGQRGDTDE